MKATRPIWELCISKRASLGWPAIWSAGIHLAKWTDGERWGREGVFHSHPESRFVSILLWGGYFDRVLRGVRGGTVRKRHYARRGPGSVRYYRADDYHDIALTTPKAWSICVWWGPERQRRFCTEDGTPC